MSDGFRRDGNEVDDNRFPRITDKLFHPTGPVGYSIILSIDKSKGAIVHNAHVTMRLFDFAVDDVLFKRCNVNVRLRACFDNLIKTLDEDGILPVAKNDRDGTIDRFDLTLRQSQILSLVSRGETNRGISAQIGISENTVKVHVQNILRRMKAKNRKELAQTTP